LKILWICNGSVSEINEIVFNSKTQGPSWLEGLVTNYRNNPRFKIAYGYPQTRSTQMIKTETDNMVYYGFFREKKNPHIYDKDVEEKLIEVINDFKPDILHVFGTEFKHSLAAISAFNNPDKTIITIQGLSHMHSKHFRAGLSNKIINSYSFHDFIHNDNMRMQIKKYEKKGELEIKAIQKASHINALSDWDKACCSFVNPDARYHFCNQILRESFYNNAWDIDKCEKYSIFCSQAYYPVKGIHITIEAFAEIIKKYPEAHLYIAGHDIFNCNSFKERMGISSYAKYIKKLIDKKNLRDNITFTGYLNEGKICERYLKSNVFVSASSIENSPNSVGEAMMLGTPVVSSDVGGVKNQMTHNEEGYLYQWDAPYMLAYYVMQIFENNEIAESFSKKSQIKAHSIYNREKNISVLNDIYLTIGGI